MTESVIAGQPRSGLCLSLGITSVVQQVLANGIALSKVHHTAFDSHLIGIDPDDRVHVSERLLALHDGPLLEQSLKAIAGTTMRLPRRREDHPDDAGQGGAEGSDERTADLIARLHAGGGVEFPTARDRSPP